MAVRLDLEALWDVIRDGVAQQHPKLRDADMRLKVDEQGVVHGLLIAEQDEDLELLDDQGSLPDGVGASP